MSADNLFTLLAAIVGLLIGAALTLLTGRVQTTHELRLKLKEKLLDRRIDAHEKIVGLANSMILMNPIMAEVEVGKIGWAKNDDGEMMRYPVILLNKSSFAEFIRNWSTTMFSVVQWLSNDLVRELYLFQDYTINLTQYLDTIDDKNTPIVGSIIRQDFIDFSMSINKLAYKYFYTDLEKLSLEKNSEWHKYQPVETRKRLFETQLFKRSDQLSKLIK